MAGFDPSIISQIPDMAPNPMGAKKDALTLAGMMDKQQLGALQLREEQRAEKERLAVKDILSREKVDYSSPEGVARTAEKLGRVSPEFATKFMKTAQDYQTGAIEQQLAKLKLADEQQGSIVTAIDSVVPQLDEMAAMVKNGKMTPAALNAATAAMVGPALDNLEQARPDLKTQIDTWRQNRGVFTYQGLKSAEGSTKQGQAFIKQRLEEHKQNTRDEQERLNQQKADQQYEQTNRRLDEQERHDRKIEEAKDPNKPMTGRESQIFMRTVNSASLGIEALKNIVELPAQATTGVFGTGHGPQKGLLESGANALKNKMADDDVKDYTTMIAGLRRNLATIETQGLAPQGTFTESLSAVEFKAGDTNMDKMRKLAEARQIIEYGLLPSLDNPRVPAEQKEALRGMITKLQQAIPFTNSDVTKLRREQRNYPKKTMKEFLEAKGVSFSDNANAAGSADLPPGFTRDTP